DEVGCLGDGVAAVLEAFEDIRAQGAARDRVHEQRIVRRLRSWRGRGGMGHYVERPERCEVRVGVRHRAHVDRRTSPEHENEGRGRGSRMAYGHWFLLS